MPQRISGRELPATRHSSGMSQKTRMPCKAPGCPTIPRKDPLYCHEHIWMRNVDDERHAGRAALLNERAANAETKGKAWISGTGTASTATRGMLASLEAGAERTQEGAAGAWRSVTALNANLRDAEQEIVGGIADDHGAGTYKDSAGNEYEIKQGKPRDKWDSEKLLDAVDTTVPDEVGNADYVAALRKHTSITYRPYRMRSIVELDKAFQSVHHGENGMRPLDEETDDILKDEFRRDEWHDIWQVEREERRPPVRRLTDDSTVVERLDVLRDVKEARSLTKDALDTWEQRAIVDKKPGEYMFDAFGSPVGKVVSGMEVRGPEHTVVNEALEQLPDRQAIRAAFTEIASVRGALRALRASDLEPDEFRTTQPGRWRANQLSD